MNLKIPAALIDATRLVREGHLIAATRAIQHALRGVAEAPSQRAHHAHLHHGNVIEGEFGLIDEGRPSHEDLPPKAAPARFVTRTFSNAAGTRDYKLYIPSARYSQPLPVVVMLHGCKQGPDDFAAGTRMNILAEQHGLIVVYPTQAAAANQSNCWNWFASRHQQRGSGEPSLIAGITREVITACGGDPQRIYVAGLSAGGAMAQVMATTYPDIYAAVGIHSGLEYAAAHDVPSAFAAMRGSRRAKRKSRGEKRAAAVPTIVFHGDSDKTVHPSNGEELIANASRVQGAGSGAAQHDRSVEHGQANGRTYTRTTYRNRDGEPVVEQWLVHGAAHAWSGGSAEGSYSDTAGPDASREMVRFFLSHTK